MPRTKPFQTVLSEAVADLRRHGYDSKARLQKWVRDLRRAARGMVGSDAALEAEIKRALQQSYRQQVTGGLLARKHSIPAYTVKKLSPTLQRELSRRTQASVDLIRLNRTKSIEETLQRFSGWATAQTPGSAVDEQLRPLKASLSKPIRSLPFEKRRVIIDQTAKLNSNLNYLTATNNKAIAVEWYANPDRLNYNHRKEHLERNGKIYALKDGWAYQKGFITKGAGFYEDMDGFGMLPFCSCRGFYKYHLDQIPDDMLTDKAREALNTNRRKNHELHTTRA